MTKRLNSRNISYVVSPAGMEEIFKRGYRYFKRTIDDVILYKAQIEKLVSEAAKSGYRCVALVGKSDLDFLVEYACGKEGIEFSREDKTPINAKVFALYGEKLEAPNKELEKCYLKNIIITKKLGANNL